MSCSPISSAWGSIQLMSKLLLSKNISDCFRNILHQSVRGGHNYFPIFQSAWELGWIYREWSSILSDRKLSPILYGGIFQNYHDWTQTANSNANIICNMLFLNHPLSTGLRTQLDRQAWRAEQHVVNRPTNASFWNIHFKVFFISFVSWLQTMCCSAFF